LILKGRRSVVGWRQLTPIYKNEILTFIRIKKIRNPKSKSPKPFCLRLGTRGKQRFTFGIGSSKSKVPIGYNADSIESKSHKISLRYIYVKVFGFSQRHNGGVDAT